MRKRKCFITAVLAILITAGAFLCAPGASAPPEYKPSEGYMSSKYYTALTEYKLTGDQRYDTVALALTQLGYHEGDSELDFDGMNTMGGKNFVEYNRIYGKVDNGEGNGTSYGYAWCAAFVSFNLRHAGVAESAAVTEISCSRMVKWYRAISTREAWKDASYVPVAGDVIFFKTGTSNSVSTHVGLVVGVKDGKIYTVEGNSGGVVGMHEYDVGAKTIVGYGIPAYTGAPEKPEYDFTLEAPDRLGAYYTTASDGLNFRAEPTSSAAKVTDPVPYWTRVDIKEIKDGWGRTEYNGKSGWLSMSYTIYADDVVYSVYYKTGKGKTPLPQRKKAGETITLTDSVPECAGYTFVGWNNKKAGSGVFLQPGDVYTADATIELEAVFERVKYSVVFKNDDGTVLSSETYEFGDRVTVPEAPAKESDGKFSYTFAGWDSEVAERVTGDATYTAKYTAEEIVTEKSSGCGSAAFGAAFIAALCGGAVAVRKKRRVH